MWKYTMRCGENWLLKKVRAQPINSMNGIQEVLGEEVLAPTYLAGMDTENICNAQN